MERQAVAAAHSASRERLLHLLAEAAEFEHNLLCCYLYAAFSLKRAEESWARPEHGAAVARWHAAIMSVAREEMTHMALVANLTASIGAHPHFNRPNLPVAPGYHPAGIVIELAPFDMDTLDHFIYLERPEGVSLADGAGFQPAIDYERGEVRGAALMPSSVDYETIAEFYDAVREAFVDLARMLGEARLFVPEGHGQIGPEIAPMPGLLVVHDLPTALKAIDTIVVQGEGASPDSRDSHYARFCAIREEFARLQAEDADFVPARPAARNPVMRRGLAGEDRVAIDSAVAAPFLDLANALYNQVLRMLAQAYACRSTADGKRLVEGSMTLMRVFGAVSTHLVTLPASDRHPGVCAGASFSMLRATEPMLASDPWPTTAERLRELARGARAVCAGVQTLQAAVAMVDALARSAAAVAAHADDPPSRDDRRAER